MTTACYVNIYRYVAMGYTRAVYEQYLWDSQMRFGTFIFCFSFIDISKYR